MSNETELLEKFSQLNVFAKNHQRAPHKPLLLLYALARLQSDGQTEITFPEAEQNVEPLINAYRPWTKSETSVSYPFSRLVNETHPIWRIENVPGVMGAGGNVKVAAARKQNLKAGFTEDVLKEFKRYPQLIDNAAMILLNKHFAPSLHEELIDALGIQLGERMQQSTNAPQRARSPQFRQNVLSAYYEQCCFCGYDMKVNGRSIGLDAAHIKWHAAQGPDEVQNSLSLCALHHRLFDFGALTIQHDHTIAVSEYVAGEWGRGITESMHGQSIKKPRNDEYLPKVDFIEWHHAQVYKGDMTTQ